MNFSTPDFLWTLFRFLGPLGNGLGGCCRAAYSIKRVLLVPPQLGRIRLSPAQAYLADQARRALAARGGFCALRAPPGFGKTAAALAVAMPLTQAAPGERWAVFVPPKALCTWRQEIGKVFGAQAFGAPRGALVLHSTAPAHGPLFAARKGGAAEPSLVLTTWPTEQRRRQADEILAWANRFVVDEAHTAPGPLLERLAGQRALLLSAQRVRLGYQAPVAEIGGAGAEWLENRCPPIDLRYARFPPHAKEARAFVGPCDRFDVIEGNLPPYVAAIREALGGLGQDRVALFLPDGRAGKLLEGAVRPLLEAGNWQVVVFARAVSKLAHFARMRRAVLLIRLTQSEALNISASHLVVVRPDWVNVDRYGQLLCRVLRPTNPSERVAATLVVPDGVAAQRVAFYNAVRAASVPEDWWPAPRKTFQGLAYERPDAADLLRADSALRLCGSRLLAASPPEVAAALGAGLEGGAAAEGAAARAESVFDAWRTRDDKTVSDWQLRTMLGLAREPPDALAGAPPGPGQGPPEPPDRGPEAGRSLGPGARAPARAPPAGRSWPGPGPADVDALLAALTEVAEEAERPAWGAPFENCVLAR